MLLERATSDTVVHGKAYKAGEFLPFYVPRDQMPQIPEDCLPNTIERACSRGIKTHFDCVDPRTLTPHQRINRHIVADMPALIKHKVILVSASGYILDGNHRWWANVEDNSPFINIIRFNLAFDEAIDWLLELPWTYEVDLNGKLLHGHLGDSK